MVSKYFSHLKTTHPTQLPLSRRAVIYLNLVRSVNFVLDLLAHSSSQRPIRPSSSSSIQAPPIEPTDDLRRIKMRLAPLRHVEQILSRRLSPENYQTEGRRRYRRDRASEVSVRSGSAWKALLKPRPPTANGQDDLQDAQRVIEACKDDMLSLWRDSTLQNGLKERDIQLEEQSGLCVTFYVVKSPDTK